MINFKISAPGRIVLTGEHSAAFKKHVFVVAGLDLRTNLEFCELSDEQRNIRIELHNLQKDVPLHDVQRLFFQIVENWDCNNSYTSTLIHLLNRIDTFIQGMWRKTEEKLSLLIFFVLLFIIAYDMEHEVKPFRLRMSTEIPFGDGFGRSTSIAVCLAACFLRWKRLRSGDHIRFNEHDLQEIEVYTKFCENILLYSEFGTIDAKVCIYGNIYKCIRNDDQSCSVKETIDLTTEIKILLIRTHCRSKKVERMVQMLELEHSHPNNFKSILNDLDEIATRIFYDLHYINNNIEDTNAYSNLQRDIRSNQKMLSGYGLSFFEVDIVSYLGSGFNLGGKLTGFRGNYVYFPLPPKITKEEITRITNLFLYRRYSYKIVTISCEGLRIYN